MHTAIVNDIRITEGIAREWLAAAGVYDKGVKLDYDVIMSDMALWMESDDADMIGLFDGDDLVGVLAIFSVPSYLGRQVFAAEKYWYVTPSCRTGSKLLLDAAKKWAKDHGASHLISSASCLMGDEIHERLGRFYRSRGFELFETMYITEV
jgi:GNAT superfamily N-acetyltransferase